MIARSSTQPKHRFHFTPYLSALNLSARKLTSRLIAPLPNAKISGGVKLDAELIYPCSRPLNLDVSNCPWQ
jgi:hypothetical protein